MVAFCVGRSGTSLGVGLGIVTSLAYGSSGNFALKAEKRSTNKTRESRE